MHQIRLSSAWKLRRLGDESPQRMNLPMEKAVAGEIHLTRSFNRPTGLENSTDVTVVLESGSCSSLRMELNGSVLFDSGTVAFPVELSIREELERSNRLEVQLRGEPCRLGEVYLRIAD